MGPLTGRGAGNCAVEGAPARGAFGAGRGMGRGMGMGRGRGGCGFGRGGGGRGFGRGLGFGAHQFQPGASDGANGKGSEIE